MGKTFNTRKKTGIIKRVGIILLVVLAMGTMMLACQKQGEAAQSTSNNADTETTETTTQPVAESTTTAAVAEVTTPQPTTRETTTAQPATTQQPTTTPQPTTTQPATEAPTTAAVPKPVIDGSKYDDGGEPQLVFTSAYAAVGQELSVVLKNVPNRDEFSYTWRVGTRQMCKEQSYTPTESDLEKFIKVTAKNGTEKYTAQIYFSELPVVYIDTENKKEVMDRETYINATCHIQGNELFNIESENDAVTWNTTGLYSGDIEIKGRGNASWTLGEREGKKPYKIKLDKKSDLFGMGKSKHWVLLADWNDKTATRNIITNDFSKAIGMEYSMELTNVVLIFNGEYEGLYEMGEQVRIEESRVDIFDWEELAEDAAKKIAKKNSLDDATKDGLEEAMVRNLSWITSDSVTYKGATYKVSDYVEIPSIKGGYLLEVDMYYDTVSKFKTEGASMDELDAQPVMFKSPEYAKTNSEMFSFIKTGINVFEQAVRSYSHYYEAGGVRLHYSDIVDMDSLVQYWLVNEFSNNFDSMKNSLFIYKDMDDYFKFGPAWDYDLAFGNKEPNAAKYNEWQTLAYSKNHQGYQWYKYLVSDPYFMVQAYELYHEKAAPYIDAMLAAGGQLEYLADYTNKAGLANLKKWPTGKHDYKTEVKELREYIQYRKLWFDKQFKSVDSLITSLRSYVRSGSLAIQKSDGTNFEIAVGDSKVKQVLVIVNGKALDTQTVKDGKVAVSVDSAYIREAGKLNVIEVFALDSNGKHIMYSKQAMKNYMVFE